jgi:ribosomal protein S18 acetylase RimI-like enzyme
MEIAKIAHEEIYDEIPLNEIEKWIKNIGNFPYVQHFVAEENNQILGFITWLLFDRYGNEIMLEIALMAIRNRFQKRRIGKKLLENSLKELKRYWLKRKLKIVMFFVDTDEENEKARRFYEKVIKPSDIITIPNIFYNHKAKIFYFKKLSDNSQ